MICMSDTPFEAGRIVVKYSLPSAATAGFCPSSRTCRSGPPPGDSFLMEKPVAFGGERYNHRLSGDQHAQPPPSLTLWSLVPSAFISHASTFHPLEARFT